MREVIEQSHQFASSALAALKGLGLAATPHNLEVWYAHAQGRNPALSRDIQRYMSPDGAISQEQATDLYERHILRGDFSRDVIDLVRRFENELLKLADTVEETGENNGENVKKLTSLSGDLEKAADENPGLNALLDSVISVTRAVRESNRQLEKQLAQSSDEVAYLRQSVEAIQQEAMTDPLTGIKNRKVFDREIVAAFRDAENEDHDLTMVIADVDHFKKFNDRWGHQTGDQVLRLVAEVMDANVKGQDILARYGGEEFAIILPKTSLENGHMLADRIRRAVEMRRLKKRRTNESLGLITLSMGVATRSKGDTTDSLIERADKCLYAAKQAGRNRVINDSELEKSKPSDTETSAA